MSDQAGFHAALANPDDHHARAVFADRLQDSGHDAHADRLRWWAGALAHLQQNPTAAGGIVHGIQGLPRWVRALGVNHAGWAHPAGRGDAALNAMHALNERQAIGLAYPEERPEGTDTFGAVVRRALHGHEPAARRTLQASLAARMIGEPGQHEGPDSTPTLAKLAQYARDNPPPAQEGLQPVRLARPEDILNMKASARATPHNPTGSPLRPGDRNRFFVQDHTAGKVLADALDEEGQPHAPFFRNLAHHFDHSGVYHSDKGMHVPQTGRSESVGPPSQLGWTFRHGLETSGGKPAAVVEHGHLSPASWGPLNIPGPNLLHAAIMDKAALHEWAAHKDIPPTLRAAIVNAADALPEEPVKNSRIGDWVRGLFSKPAPARHPKDGIVHTHAADPSAAFSEHNTFARAIHGLTGEAATDPAHVAMHMDAAAKIAKEKPDLPMVKRYIELARGIGGTAGPELTEAAKPLVSAANMLLHVAGKAKRFVKPTPEGAPRPMPSTHTAPETEAHATAPVEAPFELVDDAKDEPAEDRHTAIMRMKKAGADNETIIQHLIDAHGAPHRKAAQASIRAAFNRAIVLHQKSKGTGKGPTKLAAYSGRGAIHPTHTTGDVSRRDKGGTHGFSRGIEGTALAFHLRQIQKDHPKLATLAGRALSHGTTTSQGDPFAELGEKLKGTGHVAEKAHDWANLRKQFDQDALVHAFVTKHVENPHALEEHAYWGAVNRQFGKGTHKQVEEFWKRFERAHPGISREEAKESIFRLRDHAIDREYTAGVNQKGGDKEQWRETMSARGGNNG